jgi:REP element-mobilizing transposase RayT
MRQLGLNFQGEGDPRVVRTRGGARKGAGRKRLPAALRCTPHRARAKHRARHPVHVTLRAFTRSLRSQHVAGTVLNALRDSNSPQFRVVHHSVQDNHLHLLVEAESKRALSSGVRGLMIRIARRVNQLLFRRGRFWADRWHGSALTSLRQVRNALVYVLKNRRKHAVHPGKAGKPHSGREHDALSSIQWFDGLAAPLPRAFRSVGPPCVAARTWLLCVGWKIHGLIKPTETPKGKHWGQTTRLNAASWRPCSRDRAQERSSKSRRAALGFLVAILFRDSRLGAPGVLGGRSALRCGLRDRGAWPKGPRAAPG